MAVMVVANHLNRTMSSKETAMAIAEVLTVVQMENSRKRTTSAREVTAI